MQWFALLSLGWTLPSSEAGFYFLARRTVIEPAETRWSLHKDDLAGTGDPWECSEAGASHQESQPRPPPRGP